MAVMPREKDPLWKYVTFLNENNSKWRCNFCGLEDGGGATRVKAHLAGIACFGFKRCERVDVDVKAEARDGLMPKKGIDSSDRGVFKERIQGNVGAAPTHISHLPNMEGGTNLQFPRVMLKGTPGGASSCQYGQTTVPHFNDQLAIWNEECGTETSSFPLREAIDTCPPSATLVNLQVLKGGSNMAGPSSSQALVPSQRQSVPHQCINDETRNAEQYPTMPSSSWKNRSATCRPQSLLDMDPCMISSSHPPKDAPPPHVPSCGAGLISPLPELDINKGAPMTSHPNTCNNFEENRALRRKLELLYSREAGLRNELEFAKSLSLKKLKMGVLADEEKPRNDFHSIEAASENCLAPRQQVDILMWEAEEAMRRGKKLKGLLEARETKVVGKLIEGKMVGEAFGRNTAKILDYLVGNEVSRLGICGMGGVGKTTIMVHIHNRLLEKANFDNVLWITVSQDFNTQKLQDDIWEELSLDRLQETDVRKRAAMLSDLLTKRGKSIIILDDVWETFDLENVGIPVGAYGVKLVLTTRSIYVCHQMHCQANIKIEPLCQKEAESLFLEEVGSKVALNLETEAIVKSIVKECAGLPLGVIMMARIMRGVTNLFEWKDSLLQLRELDIRRLDMEKLFMKLEFSYIRLGDHEVQQCFLSCALYPKDELIDKFELIEFFIDQGLIGGLSTREEQYDRGLTILNKLESVCLLENHGSKIKMHNLIRDMALRIMSTTSVVKAGKGLTRIPPKEYWTEALEKVSLMKNGIREFPLNMSPNCPKLSTCLLNGSLLEDVVIPDSFFRQLWGLKVLNLSGCKLRELPNSISDLGNLRALLLRECSELCHLPYLGKLTTLKKLDACGCVHLEALEGLEMLVNLRYLDLADTRIKRLAEGTLGGLLNLQYLKVEAVNEEEFAKLWALETLQCYFKDVDGFNKCVSFIEQSNPCCYRLNVDQEESVFHVAVGDDAQFGNRERIVHICKWSHAIVSMGGKHAGICILIPRDVQTLSGKECNGTTNLSSMGPLEYLESLNIEVWKNLRVLCGGQDEEMTNIHDSPLPTPTCPLFPSLRVLKISQCPKLKYLFGHGSKFYLPHLREIELCDCEEMVGIIAAVTPATPCSPLAFPSVEKIHVVRCNRMKRLVECEWLPHLPNLKYITVDWCASIEEIIGGPPPHTPLEEISIEDLVVCGCDSMRRLFPHELLILLQNLQAIHVACCKGMVEMISRSGQRQERTVTTLVNNTPPSSFESSISLPKLTVLCLDDLPQLKSICEVSILCDSLVDIHIHKCPDLNRIALQLRLGDNLPYIELGEEEKWKMLTWDHPNAMAILQPYLHFSDGGCVLQWEKRKSGRC